MSDMKTRAEKLASLSVEQLIKRHSKNMVEIEAIVDEGLARLEARAGEDRSGADAQALANLRAARCDLMAYHNRMDALAAQLVGTPVARSGEGR